MSDRALSSASRARARPRDNPSRSLLINRRKLLGTSLAIIVLGSVALAANRMGDAAVKSGPRSGTDSQAAGAADGMVCPYSGKHGPVAAPLDSVPAEAASSAAACPQDASGKTACPHGAGADAADCPMHKTDAPPDCCKGKATTP